ncbi:MAG TPA: GNAT family N-acetyltransferase [Anaerolineales bacterium]|nr:GNAT family N-acetyltransferase [Anaerolineales bacterium]HRF46100.1 GNAT family N-acetyltransferase [Anaerolineales bacterium]
MTEPWLKDGFEISIDPARLQIDAIADALTRTYWANGRPREVVARSLEHSRAYGLYAGDRQIGLARVVTDQATFAYLCDVYVLEEYRGRGLGKWLIDVIVNDPALAGLRRWLLATRDAHGLYRQYGFTDLQAPGLWMERFNPGGTTPTN